MRNRDKVFIRLYDYCIEDDRQPPYPRAYIFRKHRVIVGVSLLILHLMLFVFLIDYNSNIFGFIITGSSLMGFLGITRLGVLSFYYQYELGKMEKDSNLSILEKIILESNYENNKLVSNQENNYNIKNHFSWLKHTFGFRDKKFLNLHFFTVTRKSVLYMFKPSKKYKALLKEKNIMTATHKEFYSIDYFENKNSTKDFQKEIFELYIAKREEVSIPIKEI